MSYLTRIVQYMRTHKGITVGECRDNIGTTELRTRICDLKKMGYVIISQNEKGPNSNGTMSRYSRYFLIKEPELLSEPKYPPRKKKPAKQLDLLNHINYHKQYQSILDLIKKGETKKNDL